MKPMKDSTCDIFLTSILLALTGINAVTEIFSKNIEFYVISVYSLCIKVLKIIFLKSL